MPQPLIGEWNGPNSTSASGSSVGGVKGSWVHAAFPKSLILASLPDLSVLEGVLRRLRDHPDAFGQLAFAAAAYVLPARLADAGSAARRSIQLAAWKWGRDAGRLSLRVSCGPKYLCGPWMCQERPQDD